MTVDRYVIKAVFIGVISRDTIALVDAYPESNERVRASQVVHATGGPADTAAVACARQGIDVALAGAVGEDAAGEAVCSALADERVDISGIESVADAPTSQSVIVVDRCQKTRAISNLLGPSVQALGLERWAATAAWIHVDAHGWPYLAAAKQALSRAAVSVDEGNSSTGQRLDRIDLYVPTLSVLRERFGDSDVDELLTAAQLGGAVEVVTTDGENGAFGRDANGLSYRCRAFTDIDIVSTLGAGDVFHGALVAARIHGLVGDKALAYASMTAALSCRALDGQSGIPTRNEVQEHLAAPGH